jgi:hypothetical protein
MAPNRIRRRASSNPATGASGPTQGGTATAPSLSLPKSPGSGLPACRLDTRGGHPILMLRDKTEQRDGRSTMPTCAYPARVPLLDYFAYVA